MKDLTLIDGDLAFIDGDFTFVEDELEVAQGISIEMGTNKGELFFNNLFGLDFQKVLGKASEAEARAEVLDVLSREERIAEINSLTILSDTKNRQRHINYSITLVDGTLISEGVSIDA